MKKFIVFLCIFLFPINVLAYSNEVILGGNTIGIDIKSNGIMIIGFYKVKGNIINKDLKEGDIITKVGNITVNSTEELTKAIEKNLQNNKVNITYSRNGIEKNTVLELTEINGMYKTGLYVKDSITGIGTITFIDPETNTYGALGHEIIESNTSKIVEVKSGTIFRNTINDIDESIDGKPGSKNAKFYYGTKYGDIAKNTKYGIYGTYNAEYNDSNLIEINEEVKIGAAKIYTVIDDENIEEFDIEITKINENSDIKNITFEITDKELLEATGGIVQGMSGSPIVQNGKLIGAVTHVITNNVATGYGLFITTMLEESER